MTTLKSLPARPSQQSLRKQAKKLAHDIGAGNAASTRDGARTSRQASCTSWSFTRITKRCSSSSTGVSI
jgi:hypothetical protein